MTFHNRPLVSVMVPLFHSKRFVADIIANLEAIDYSNVEILLSDRHGEVDAVEVLARHFTADSRVRVLVAHDRLNWVDHYNLLMRSASGKYVMWMPHDDLYPGGYVSQLVTALERHPDAVLAYGRLETISVDGSPVPGPIRSVLPVDPKDPWSVGVALRLLFFWNIWITFRGLMRREIVMQWALFIRPTLDLVEADVYWLFALALKGRFCFVPECFCTKRFHSTSASAPWKHGRLRYLLNAANVLRAYISQVLSRPWEIWYAMTMVCCWTLLRIAGSWTRNWAWMGRRRGWVERLAEGLLFPRRS